MFKKNIKHTLINSVKKVDKVLIFLMIILISLIYFYRPWIQDEAWMSSFALSNIKYNNPMFNGVCDDWAIDMSYKSYYNWFNFIPMELFIKLFGYNYLAVRIHMIIYLIFALFLFAKWLKKEFKYENGITVFIIFCIFINPEFHKHIWNRAEFTSIFFILLSINVLYTELKYKILISIFLLSISFDVHPTSLFLSLPLFIYSMQSKSIKFNFLNFMLFVIGGFLGIIVIILSKIQFFSPQENVYNFILASLHFSGGTDHYSPIFYFFQHRFYLTEKLRLLPFLKLLIPIIFLIILNFKFLINNDKFRRVTNFLFISITMSIFLIDTTENGYQLYILFSFSIFIILLIQILPQKKINNSIILLFIFLITTRGLYITTKMLNSYIKEYSNKSNFYENVFNEIGNVKFIGASPIYNFEANKRDIKSDYYFSIWVNTLRHNTSVIEEFKKKNYDALIIDIQDYNFFIEEKRKKMDVRSVYYRNLPFTSEYKFKNYLKTHYNLIDTLITPIGTKHLVFKSKNIIRK